MPLHALVGTIFTGLAIFPFFSFQLSSPFKANIQYLQDWQSSLSFLFSCLHQGKHANISVPMTSETVSTETFDRFYRGSGGVTAKAAAVDFAFAFVCVCVYV